MVRGNDPFANDPLVVKLERDKRDANYQNYRDKMKTYHRPNLDNPGPCEECGCDVLAREGFSWCCAECGDTRFSPRVFRH